MRRAIRWIVLLVLAAPGVARAGLVFDAGHPDPTFGTNGVTRVPSAGGTFHGISGFDLLPDGRIVAVGRHEYGVMLVRYLGDGSLDPAFGTGGVVTAMPGTGIWSYDGIALQPDGKAVVSGTHADPALERFIARHDDTGAVDAGFGTNGMVFLGAFGMDTVAGPPRIQPDGAILVGGSVGGAPVLARLDDDGDADPTFGTGGVASLDIGPAGASATLVDHRLLPDGRIVVLVQANSGSGTAVLVLARYDAHGVLDPTFGDGGTVEVAPATGAALARQPDGKLVVNGTVPGFDVVPDQLATWRFQADGVLDPDFGDGGVTSIPYFSPSFGGPVSVQADGKIVIGGSGSGFARFLARYQPDGNLDVTFGSQGVSEDFPEWTSYTGFALQADGKLVASSDFLLINVVLVRWRMEGDCPAVPRSGGCKVARSTLLLREGTTDAGDRFEWTWTKGPATELSEFGNPVESTYYIVCLYDESGTPRLIFESGVRAAEICPPYKQTCWQPVRDVGFQYSVPSGSFHGTTRVLLKAGTAGKTKAVMKARGRLLSYNHPPLPLSAPLRMQFVGSNGLCLEAGYPSASVVRNDAREFKVKSEY
jgi:uncharacterized delta-60 repeat protein